MANQIIIDIIANDLTTSGIDAINRSMMSIGRTAESVGRDITRNLTDPIMDLVRDLGKTEEIKTALEPVKTAFDEVFGELATALVPLIEELTPVLLDFIDMLSDLVKIFSDMGEPMQLIIIGFVAFVAILGPLITLIGGFLTVCAGIGTVLGVAGTAVAGAIAVVVAFYLTVAGIIANTIIGIKNFVEAFTYLRTNAGEIVAGMVANIKTKFQELKDFIGSKLTEIKNNIIAKVGEWRNAGGELIMGLVHGVTDKAGELLSSVVSAVQDAYNAALDFLGIKSPSKLFAEVGKNMMLGWAEGINNTALQPQLAMSGASSGMVSSALPSRSGSTAGNTIILNYSPVVSLADRYEAETKLVPYIESALRKIR